MTVFLLGIDLFLLRKVVLGLALALAMLYPAPVKSQQNSTYPPVTAGVFETFTEHSQNDEDGVHESLIIHLLNELSKQSGLKISIKKMASQSAAIEALSQGEIDLIPNFVASDQRQNQILLTRPVETFRISMFVKNNFSDITSHNDLRLHRIGVVKGLFAQKIFDNRPEINPIVYPNISSALIALLSGEINALVQSEHRLWHIAKRADLAKYLKIVGDPVAVIERSIAVKRRDSALLLKLNEAIDKLAKSDAHRNIYTEWFALGEFYWRPKTITILIGSALLAGLILMGIWRYLTVLRLNKELSTAITHAENLTDELTSSNQAYRALYQTSPYAYVTCSTDDLVIQNYNPAFSTILGFQDRDTTALTLYEVCTDTVNGKAKIGLLLERFKSGGVIQNEEIELKRLDGRSIWVSISIDPVSDKKKDQTEFRAAFIDVTDRKMVENILRDSEVRFKDFANAAADRFWETDSEHRYSYVSDPSGHINTPFELLVGRHPWEIDRRNFSQQNQQELRQRFQQRDPFRGVRLNWTNLNGNARTVSVNGVPIWNEDGSFKGFRGTTIDITEQVQALEKSADNRRKLVDALDSAADGIILWDADDRMVLCNDNYRQSREQVAELLKPGIHFNEFIENLAKRYDLKDREDWIANAIALHKNPPDSYERQHGGQYYLVHKRRLEDGSTIAFESNITDLKQRENALKESEARFSKIFQASPNLQSISEIDSGILVDVNDVWLASLKFTRDQVIGKTAEELGITIDFTNNSRMDMITKILRHGPTEKFEGSLTTADGEERKYIANADIIELGGVNHLLLVSDDITDERRIAEELHQAQKMEAVGQLTGGIAHDFNNILSSVLGNLELMAGDIKKDSKVIGYIDRAKKSVLRAADLTKRLLAFSRKQALNSQSTNLNDHIPNILAVIERTLGESVTIKFESESDLGQCLVDRNQLDNALINIAINARDAMPKGGKINFKVANKVISEEYATKHREVESGNYVELKISDTGEGIAPEYLERVIEPFFTTKDVGQGSGLGLSMVYGFIKQSGGFLSIESELGQGTHVSLFIPRTNNKEIEIDGSLDLKDVPLGKGEAVLVIEDDPDVREVAINTLEHLGYASIDGGDGTNIKEFTDQHSGHLDLILTDMILPDGQTGLSVTHEVLGKFPEVKIIFMTGYADDEIIENVEGQKYPVVGKPFEADTLARTIYETLNA